MVGAPGGPLRVVGVAKLEAPDQALVPRLVIVRAQQRYAVPPVRPVTTIGELLPLPLNAGPVAAAHVTWWLVSTPPLRLAGVKVTLTCPAPAVAVPIVGADGAAPVGV